MHECFDQTSDTRDLWHGYSSEVAKETEELPQRPKVRTWQSRELTEREQQERRVEANVLLAEGYLDSM